MLQFESHSNSTILITFRNVDLVVGAQSRHRAQSKNLIDSQVYFQDDVTWCVQKAKGRPKWTQILLVADWKIFLCIFGAVFPTIWVLYVLSGFERRPLDVWTAAFSIIRSIGLSSSTFYPERNSMRFTYFLLLILCFFVSSVWCSFMFIIITSPFNEHQISNSEEIVNANFRLVAEEETKQFLIDRNMVIDAIAISVSNSALTLSFFVYASANQRTNQNIRDLQ